MMAAFSLRHGHTPLCLAQIVVNYLAEAKGKVRQDVYCGHDFEHRQFCHRRQCVWAEIKRRRPGPGAFDRDILEVVLDELADAWRAVDMRYDLQQEVRCDQ